MAFSRRGTESNTKKRSYDPIHSVHSPCENKNAKRPRTSSVDLFEDLLFLDDDQADALCSQVLSNINSIPSTKKYQPNHNTNQSRIQMTASASSKSSNLSNSFVKSFSSNKTSNKSSNSSTAHAKSSNPNTSLVKSYSYNSTPSKSSNSNSSLAKSYSSANSSNKTPNSSTTNAKLPNPNTSLVKSYSYNSTSSKSSNSNSSFVKSPSSLNAPLKSTNVTNLQSNSTNYRENKFFKSRNSNNQTNSGIINNQHANDVRNGPKNCSWNTPRLANNQQQSSSTTHSSNNLRPNSPTIEFVPSSPEHTAFVSQISMTIQDDSSVSTISSLNKLKINSQSSQIRTQQREMTEKFCAKMKELKLVFDDFDMSLGSDGDKKKDNEEDDDEEKEGKEEESESDSDSVSIVFDSEEEGDESGYDIGQYYKSINSLVPSFHSQTQNINTSLHFLNPYLEVYSQSDSI